VQPALATVSTDARIAALFAGASMEAAVKNLADIDAYPAVLPAGMQVYLPWLPGLPFSHVVSVARRLAAKGFAPVPHIAARRLADWESAEDFISRLAQIGVTQALVIAGDVDRPVGPFEDAAALLECGLLQKHGIRRIGIAGYPEGHPRIADHELRAALKHKLAIGRATGLDLYIVSQFCFDAQSILGWLEGLAAQGVKVPVHVGLAGPASVRTLISYGMRCGVGPSLRALRSHGVSLTRLVAQTGPDAIVAALAAAESSIPFKLHFFSFGGVEKTARWMKSVNPKS
jgi:methylenetetrahydrofolate reductase (NADPH)